MNCPHCNNELNVDETYVSCSKCGFLLAIEWIKDVYELLTDREKGK
jgi:hypothetical protein